MRGFFKPLKGPQTGIARQGFQNDKHLFGVFLIGDKLFYCCADCGDFSHHTPLFKKLSWP